MGSYKAEVVHGDRYWVVTVEGVGATQARHLGELEAMTRDLIAVMTDEDPAAVEVKFDIRLPEEVQAHLGRASVLREEAAKANADAAVEARIAAQQLYEAGLSLRDIGRALGISHQRAHQLVHRG